MFNGPKIIGSALAMSLVVSAGAVQPLLYAPDVGSKFQYEIDIQLQLGPATTLLRDSTLDKIELRTESGVTFSFQGGLVESQKNDSQPGGSRYGGPRLVGPPPSPRMPSLPPPFGGAPLFGGMTPTTSQITLNRPGGLVAMRGESDLPFLLGHLSLLPFEPLGGSSQTAREIEGASAVELITPGDRRGFSVFPPFGDGDDRDVRAGQSKKNYKIIRQDDATALIPKESVFTMPAEDQDLKRGLTGSGQWDFDNRQQMPASIKKMSVRDQAIIEGLRSRVGDPETAFLLSVDPIQAFG